MDFRVTYIGGPTAILEIGGLRVLTDPTFDPAGRRYHFGWGTFSRKLQDPAIAPADLGRIDAVLLSHDHHDDNLDPAGRALLPSLGTIVTTRSGAGRLGGAAVGLAPWATTTLDAPDGTEARVTATPARHGPPGSRPLVGEVVGFVLEWEDQRHGAVWISGDTVYFNGVGQVGWRYDVGTALVNLGGVRFPISGPARYTMNAADAVRVTQEFGLRTLVPLHFEGWKHFREDRAAAERTFLAAGLQDRVRWPVAAQALAIEA